MKDPQYLYPLNTTASLADVIEQVNKISSNINFMWNPDDLENLK
jgi:hypothetical protein|tara:strand:- start:666 stop:797 length:132 start_codon:yes stop_codon:yes gene_type:complete